MPTAALLLAALLALAVPLASLADEPGWRRAITTGEAAYRSGDYAEAGFAFGTALKNAESFGESDTRVATSLGWLAETYRLQGRLAEAEPLLKRALAIRERVLGPTHPSTHLTRHNLTVLQRALADPGATPAPPQSPSARQSELAPLKEAARPVEVITAKPVPRPPAVEVEKPKPAPEPESKPFAALFSLFTPKPSPVPENVGPSRIEADEIKPKAPPPPPPRVAIPQPAPVAPPVVIEAPKPAPIIEPAPKPKPEPVATPIATVLPKPAPAAPAPRPYSPREAQRADLAAQLGALGASPEQARQAFELVQRARTHRGGVPLAAAQAMLAPGEVMLSYLVSERSSHVVALRHDRAALFALDMGREQIAASVKRLRAQLDPARDQGIAGRFPEFAFDVSLGLYRSLVAPAAAFLEGAAHLIVVPDEALQGLPFPVLVTEPVPQQAAKATEPLRPAWLARRFAISVLPDEQSLQAVRRTPSAARKPFAGFGDPERPESRYLLEAMADILQAGDGDVYVGAEARDAAVRRMDLAGFRVLAFGSPARMADDRADGLLTADEVSRLRLDTDLVMLTSGSTAAADGTSGVEGLPRLARAFIDAGSRSLVVPHWTVSADSTLKLVSRMLRDRVRGAGNAEALRRAMLALMNGEDRIAYTHPMYWAALQVIGEGAAAPRY